MNPPNPTNPQHDPIRMDAAELADLYAAGALTPSEMERFEARLAQGDEQLRRELQRVRPVLDALLDVQPIAPGRHLREGIEARVEADERPRRDARLDDTTAAAAHATRRRIIGGEETGDAFTIVRLGGGTWLPTGVRGVRFRQLSASRRANRRTILLQMDPGTELPDHDHAGLEEVLVVSGELRIGSTVLGAGDYFRVGSGVRHETPRSDVGCVCLIVSGYQPFPIRSWISMAWQMVRGWFRR